MMNMENTELHTEKVKILSRLIKETSLTLEEALLLLKDEHEEAEAVISVPSTSTGTWSTVTINPPAFISTYGGITGSTSSSFPLTGSGTSFTNTIADNSVDLNN